MFLKEYIDVDLIGCYPILWWTNWNYNKLMSPQKSKPHLDLHKKAASILYYSWLTSLHTSNKQSDLVSCFALFCFFSSCFVKKSVVWCLINEKMHIPQLSEVHLLVQQVNVMCLTVPWLDSILTFPSALSGYPFFWMNHLHNQVKSDLKKQDKRRKR